MIKNFESKYSSDAVLKVGDGGSFNELHVLIGKPGAIINDAGIYLESSTVPALALAEMEAAGYSEDQGTDTNEAMHHFGMAMLHLRLGIEEKAKETAEAEAQAKLKAEALRLANEFYGTDWDFFPCSRTVEMQQWLAVARKAREMRSEK